MIKNYSESAFNELVKTLHKNVDGGNVVDVFIDILNNADEKFPGLKNAFIHDMGSFLTHWFNMVNDSKSCSKKLRAKILTVQMMSEYSDFNNFTVFCYDKIDQAINERANRLYTDVLLSYLVCLVKAIVQTTRRSIGIDTNSKKYGVSANEGTTAVSE